MRTRLITTITLWALILCTLIFGKIPGAKILLLVISFGVLFELIGILHKLKVEVVPAPMLIALGLILGGHFWGFASIGTSAALILTLAAHWKSPPKVLPAAILSLLIVSVGMGSLLAIGTMHHANAFWQAVWVIAVIKLSDGGAYLFGTQFGKHPLAPAISPAKTIEGLGGAIFCSLLIGLMGIALFKNPWFAPSLAIVLALVGSIGDLAESALKRASKVKDSGFILPGIGGLLDLCDSLIAAGPVAYLAIRFLA